MTRGLHDWGALEHRSGVVASAFGPGIWGAKGSAKATDLCFLVHYLFVALDRSLVFFGLGALVACSACDRGERSYRAARAVVDRHCLGCHSERPSVKAFPIAPGGVSFDTPADMKKYAERIRIRSAVDRNMPLLNKTGMTDDERETLARWVLSGAPLAP